MRHTTRRKVLRSAGVAGVAGLSALAGCGGGGGDGGSGDGGDPTPTEADPTPTPTATPTGPSMDSYLRWLPAAQELHGDPHYSFLYYDIADFQKRQDALSKTSYSQVKRVSGNTVSTIGVTPGDVENIVRFVNSDTRVVTGSFGRSDVEKALRSQDYEKGTKYQNYRFYTGGQNPPVIAIGDGVALLCRSTGPNEATAVARMLVDTGRGKLTRYVDSREGFALVARDLTDVTHAAGGMIPERSETNVQQGTFSGMIGFGVGFNLGSSTTDLQYVLAFSSEDAASQAPVTSWAKQYSSGLKSYDGIDVATEGRRVAVTGSTPTGKFDFLAGGTPR